MRSVYVIGDGAGLHKIGLSGNPHRRRSALQSAAGRRLTLAAAHPVPDARAVERLAHWLLRACHEHGEWFKVDAATACAALNKAIAMAEAGETIPPAEKVPGGPGRPATGRDPLVAFRLPAEMIAQIDIYAREDGITRSEWVRRALWREAKRRARTPKPPAHQSKPNDQQ